MGRRDVPGEGKPFRKAGNTRTGYPSPRPPHPSQDLSLIHISHPRLDADLLARLGSVRIIQTAGAGFDSVDHAAAAKLGLIVCNSPAQNAITVAEHVIGAVICLQRELAYADEAIKSGAYAQARERILGRGACELFGATVGIVGLGGIGRALAPRLAAFGATVVASDVFWPEDFAQEHGIRRVNLDELFAVSDIVTLHCPLMDATRGLVDAARLASMKPGAILVLSLIHI